MQSQSISVLARSVEVPASSERARCEYTHHTTVVSLFLVAFSVRTPATIRQQPLRPDVGAGGWIDPVLSGEIQHDTVGPVSGRSHRPLVIVALLTSRRPLKTQRDV